MTTVSPPIRFIPTREDLHAMMNRTATYIATLVAVLVGLGMVLGTLLMLALNDKSIEALTTLLGGSVFAYATTFLNRWIGRKDKETGGEE